MLTALWPTSEQFNDNNGSILTNGKVYVYYSGRAALAPTWSSADGSHVNSNPIILDNNGRAVAFADDQYTYTCVVCDFYGRELFSFDPASFGTGGGGSTTEGNDAAHWIGATGTDVQVTALADTLLPLPSSPDYEGDFVSQTTYTTISLNKGLYMVDADIRIQQDDDDLENIIKDISVYTGLSGTDSVTTSQKNWTGPEASDDRHYIHVHFIRHVADEGEDIYFQMNSPVDLSSAWIDKLSIVKLTEGGNGKNYVGGYGIDITGPVISVSGMIPESSAANFVDLSTYNTDIENIYETIAETSAMIPSGVATEQFVEDYTSAFITEDALNGYATEQWVVDQGYITSADLPDLSDYATQQWVEDQNYITSADIPPIPQDVITSGELATVSGDIVSQIPSLDGYATQQWVEDQHYITSADIPDIPEDVVTSGELATVSGDIVNMIPSVDGYATEQYVQDYTSAFVEDNPYFGIDDSGYAVRITEGAEHTVGIGTWNNESMAIQAQLEDDVEYTINCSGIGYVELWEGTLAQYTNDPANAIAAVNDQVKFRLSDLPVRSDTGTYCLWFLKPWGETYGNTVTMSYVEASQTRYALVDQIPSVQGLASEQYVQDYTSAFITSADVPHFTQEQADWNEDDQSAPDYIKNKPTIPSLDGYATEQYVQDYTSAFITSADIPDVPADVVTSGQLATVSGEIVNQIPDVSDMATQTWVNEQGFLTSIPEDLVTSGELATVSGQIMNEIPDTSDMATKTWVGQQGYLTSVPAEYATSGDLVTLSGAIENDIPDTSDMATKTWVGEQGFLTSLPEDLVTSGELATVSGDIMSQIPSQTTVSIDPTLSSGTKIAEFNINGTSGELYAPNGGEDTFWAVVGVTSFNETLAAINSGKSVFAKVEGGVFQLTSYNSSTIVFAKVIGRGGDSLGFIELDRIYLRSGSGWSSDSVPPRTTLVPDPTWNAGYVLTEVGDGAIDWAAPPSGSVPEDVVTSGQLATVSGNIMNEIPSYTAGDNISIDNDEISVSGTAGLIAGSNISITPSGDNYVISSSGGGFDQVYHDATLSGYGTSESPLSVTSADIWNAAAGMNEYPISAGPGMSIEDVSGVTVFGPDVPYLTQAVGADETVIYNGKLPNLNGNLTLSESWNNFKQIRVRGGDNTTEDHYYSSVSPSKAAFKISWAYNWMNEAYLKFSSTNDPKVWTYAANTYVHYTHTDTTVFVTQNDTATLGSGCNFKIVGIGRISGGNS